MDDWPPSTLDKTDSFGEPVKLPDPRFHPRSRSRWAEEPRLGASVVSSQVTQLLSATLGENELCVFGGNQR